MDDHQFAAPFEGDVSEKTTQNIWHILTLIATPLAVQLASNSNFPYKFGTKLSYQTRTGLESWRLLFSASPP